jgi:hypothetical protein
VTVNIFIGIKLKDIQVLNVALNSKSFDLSPNGGIQKILVSPGQGDILAIQYATDWITTL